MVVLVLRYHEMKVFLTYACDRKRRPTTLMALAVAAMLSGVFVIVMRGGIRGTLIEVVSTWS